MKSTWALTTKQNSKSILKQFALGNLFLLGRHTHIFQLMPNNLDMNTQTQIPNPLSKVKQIPKTAFQQYTLGYPSWHDKIIHLSHRTITPIDNDNKILQLHV